MLVMNEELIQPFGEGTSIWTQEGLEKFIEDWLKEQEELEDE